MTNVPPETLNAALLKYISIKGKIDAFKANAKKLAPVAAGLVAVVLFFKLRK
jgi:hypothetical protein